MSTGAALLRRIVLAAVIVALVWALREALIRRNDRRYAKAPPDNVKPIADVKPIAVDDGHTSTASRSPLPQVQTSS